MTLDDSQDGADWSHEVGDPEEHLGFDWSTNRHPQINAPERRDRE